MKAGKFILAIIAVLALVVSGAEAGSYYFDNRDYFNRDYEVGRCVYGYSCDGFGSDYVQFMTGYGVRPKLADLDYSGSPFNQRIMGGSMRGDIFYGAGSPLIVVVPSYYGLSKDSPAVRPVKRIEMGKGQQIFGSRGFTTVASSSRRTRVVSGTIGDSGNAIRETTDGEGRRVYRIFN